MLRTQLDLVVPGVLCVVDLFALTGPPVIRGTQPVLQTFDGSPRFSPGTWVQIFGANLAGSTRTWDARDFNGPQAPTSLDGVSVHINGKAGYISAISPEQITVQIPDDDA